MKTAIHRFTRRFGYQISRVKPGFTDAGSFRLMLDQHKIDVILDVGANEGQFAKRILELGYRGRIVSFEPLSAPHALLLEASNSHPSWEVAERCCIGDRDGEIDVQVAQNTIGSSIRAGTEELFRYSSDARFVDSETAPMYRLDSIADRYLKGSTHPFLKIDVQGYEDQVLSGAQDTLDRIAGLHIELCIVELYEGQKLFTEMLQDLEARGFQLYRLFPACIDFYKSGRWLAADAVLFRDGKR